MYQPQLLRVRRAREVAEIDRVRYIEAQRLVAPLQLPCAELRYGT